MRYTATARAISSVEACCNALRGSYGLHIVARRAPDWRPLPPRWGGDLLKRFHNGRLRAILQLVVGHNRLRVCARPVPRLLVADDDGALTAQLRAALRNRRIDVIQARNGTKALALVKIARIHFDVLIVKLELVEITGFQLIMAAMERLDRPRIIAITGVYSERFLDEVIRLGADKVMRGPITSKEWFEAIREVLQRCGRFM